MGIITYKKKRSKKQQEKYHAMINEIRRAVGLKELIAKDRECLKCGEDFYSTEDGNRICESCAKLADMDHTAEPSPLHLGSPGFSGNYVNRKG